MCWMNVHEHKFVHLSRSGPSIWLMAPSRRVSPVRSVAGKFPSIFSQKMTVPACFSDSPPLLPWGSEHPYHSISFQPAKGKVETSNSSVTGGWRATGLTLPSWVLQRGQGTLCMVHLGYHLLADHLGAPLHLPVHSIRKVTFLKV